MKRVLALLGIIVLTSSVIGCNNSAEHDVSRNAIDYSTFTDTFKDSYTKYVYETYWIDADEMTDFFIDDLEKYENKLEIFEDEEGNIRKSFKNKGTICSWKQYATGGVFISINETLARDDEKLKEQAQSFIESLDIQIEYAPQKEYQNSMQDNYRQIIDGIPISTIQGNVSTDIIIDTEGAFSMLIVRPIGEVSAIEVYETSEFLTLDFIQELLVRYREKEAANCGREDANVAIAIENVEIVYYISIENGQNILEPMYEIDVLENEDGARYRATYIVDVLTGYVEYRVGDAYWL